METTKNTSRQLLHNLYIALIASLILLGIAHLSTAQPWGVSTGFPLDYSYGNPLTCGHLNAFNGCGYSYNPLLVGLDFLFWLAITFKVVSAGQYARTFHQRLD